MEGRFFPSAFERREKFLYFCKEAALSIRALWGNLEGVRLLGLLREKENAYLGSFSWIQRTLKVKSGGHWKF
jgi:hypothetical protein